ncbi:TIGR04104 family putative zinc finger protein [Bacillus sp. MUM 13]|uniref:TIGR04104 family putative zinc finger protein n=1 Tax=Bacillus sp. MUM 13 TaxID=1678001 RepID=UPI0009F1CBF0|nr:TIGR04104 family putative zinc finger protein [Bacillus sp. MUM 13]
MPICQNCGNEWSWYYTVKQLLTFHKSMKCNHCGKIQYERKASRYTTISFLLPLVIISIIFSIVFDLSISIVVLLSIALLIIVILLHPFSIKLSDKEELS